MLKSTKTNKKSQNMKVITPREAKRKADEKLKNRIDKLKTKLPTNWIVLFVHDNNDYKGQSTFLSNVLAKRSMHLETIEKLETFVKQLKAKK